MTFPDWKRPRRIISRNVVSRNSQVADSTFILKLRTGELKSRHMPPKQNDHGAHQSYLRRHA